jgi:hypothetical protein
MILVLALIGILMAPAVATAGDPLFDLLSSVDKQARSDLSKFTKTLSSTFGLPVPDVEGLFKALPDPGDVYMALRLGELSKQPLNVVVTEIKTNKGKGWGVIAKNLGIKPGSAEFHALKQNRLPDYNVGGSSSPGKSKGKGKGKKK